MALQFGFFQSSAVWTFLQSYEQNEELAEWICRENERPADLWSGSAVLDKENRRPIWILMNKPYEAVHLAMFSGICLRRWMGGEWMEIVSPSTLRRWMGPDGGWFSFQSGQNWPACPKKGLVWILGTKIYLFSTPRPKLCYRYVLNLRSTPERTSPGPRSRSRSRWWTGACQKPQASQFL